jgi:hypothetical protein
VSLNPQWAYFDFDCQGKDEGPRRCPYDDPTLVELKLNRNVRGFKLPNGSRRSLPFSPISADFRQHVGLGHTYAQARHELFVFQ